MFKSIFWIGILSLGLVSPIAYGFEPTKGDYSVYKRYYGDYTNLTQVKNKIESIENRFGVMVYGVGKYRLNTNAEWTKLGVVEQFDPAMRNSYFENVHEACSVLKGEVETLQLDSGVYEACKVFEKIGNSFEVTTYYAAQIPFGIVKQVVKQRSDSKVVFTELVSFGNI